MRTLRLGLFSLLLPAFVAACSSDAPTSATSPARVVLNFLTPATVRSVAVTVSGPGISPSVIVNIPVGADSTARDTLDISAGSARRFRFSAFDTAGVETHRADTTLTLVAGPNVPLAVRLMPLSAAIGVTITFGGSRVVMGDSTSRVAYPGDSVTLTATATSSNGQVIPPSALTWASTNPAVARVDAGVVRALAPGQAEMTVSYLGSSARISLRVLARPANSGLLAWYPLDQGGADASGLGNTGSIAGGTATADRFGNSARAVAFDGTGGGLASAANLLDAGRPAYAISLWFRIRSLASASLCAGDGIDGLINSTPHAILGLAFDCTVAGKTVLGVNDGVNGRWLVNEFGNFTGWQANRWYHVILQKEGTRYRVFVDGVMDQDVTLAAAANFSAPFTVRIGGDTSLGGFYLNGDVDEVRVYGRALSAAEIGVLAGERP